MQTIILKSDKLVAEIKAELKQAVTRLAAKGLVPRMCAIAASADPAIASYIKSKQELAESLGVVFDLINLDTQVSQEELESKISQASADSSIHGIILEMPLASHLNANRALEKINPKKDIDGLTFTNLGLVLSGHEDEAILAATPRACIILAESQSELDGKNVVVVGRGRTVGRPLVPQLLNRHATVRVCHTHTKDIKEVMKKADVVIIAIGHAKYFDDSYFSEGQIVIDVGINSTAEGLVGDVDAEKVAGKVAALTPVPGGVGALTSALIFKNLIKAIKLQNL